MQYFLGGGKHTVAENCGAVKTPKSQKGDYTAALN